MDVTPYVSALREDLVSAAAAGDEQTRRTAALLGAAIEPAARLAVMNALADLAQEVTDALDGEHTVQVRLDGREVRVVVDSPTAGPPPGQPPPPPPPPGMDAGAGDISRITLRLVEEIKGRAERAANQQGLSLNAWISQAVQGALHGAQGGPGWDHRPGRGRGRGWDRGPGWGWDQGSGWDSSRGDRGPRDRDRGPRDQGPDRDADREPGRGSGRPGRPGRDDDGRLRGWVQG
jgi:uncharacterized protein (DUF1778 family)